MICLVVCRSIDDKLGRRGVCVGGLEVPVTAAGSLQVHNARRWSN